MLATASRWNVPGKYGRFGELHFFLKKKKEPAINEATDEEDGRSFTDEEGANTMWRPSCCALVCILRAASSCKPSCEEELCKVVFRWTCCTSVRTERKVVL